nr:hypothetical protein CFP56_32449 [Quercus suber]
MRIHTLVGTPKLSSQLTAKTALSVSDHAEEARSRLRCVLKRRAKHATPCRSLQPLDRRRALERELLADDQRVMGELRSRQEWVTVTASASCVHLLDIVSFGMQAGVWAVVGIVLQKRGWRMLSRHGMFGYARMLTMQSQVHPDKAGRLQFLDHWTRHLALNDPRPRAYS